MNKAIFMQLNNLLILLFFLASTINVSAQKRALKVKDIPQVDTLIENFMKKYKVPGASIAITKGEKLVYVKTYGYADTLKEEKMHPKNLFRIASISKPITAIAMMKLVEQGKLTLDTKVFGADGILGTKYGTKPYDERVNSITVKHLLQQTCGGWGNTGGKDPMFLDASWSMEQVINYTLDNTPLLYEPGQRYIYSNFGYCLLGRVIETITGQSYEDYVKKNILLPMGITNMQIGGNTLGARLDNEVIYYGQVPGGLHPYIYNITRMDAHGGWVASATDLVRLLVHVDGFENKKDILSASSVKKMSELSTAENNTTYAYGWRVDKDNNWWHAGSLPGTGTHLARRANGFNWTVLTNTRVTGKGFFDTLAELLNGVVIDDNVPWSKTDLFLK